MNTFMSAFSAAGLTDLASYIRPIPEKYEGPNINYRAVMSQDPKRKAMHIHAIGDHPPNVLQASSRVSFIDPRNSNEDTPFLVAARVGRRKDIVDFFIENEADVNAKNNQGNTPLHLYILAKKLEEEERVSIIDALLKGGAELNVTNRDGLTPLALAVQHNVGSAIQILKQRGATT